MIKLDPTMAQRVAQAISVFQERRTGYPPKAVTVVLSDDTLVVTLHEALSPAEKALSLTPQGAAQVQEFHRQLFKDSVGLLREEIKRITGVAVGEAAAEMETTTGAIVHAFTTGTMVQVFQLADRISAHAWNGNGASVQSRNKEGLPC
ncbi:MAG: Na-translocating system protein MpsC family protein [Planctomycetota bacterium]|nr:Na-translocating system protein MpsC family protein [Planctomycetota bacterium]